MHLPRPVVRALSGPSYRLSLNPRLPVAAQRRLSAASSQLLRPPRGTHIDHVRLGGCHAERVTFGASRRPRAVLYLHGGAYILGSARMYRAMAGHLARAGHAVVYTLDYRLAPEHPYPAALEDAVAAFRAILAADNLDPAHVAIAGDSAGGGLAVAAARVLTDAGQRPGALALLSPWTDPSDTDMPERDFVVRRSWGHRSAGLYRGTTAANDPGYAPMHLDDSDFAKLPPLLVHAAAGEMLSAQIRRFSERADDAGADVRYVELPGFWHSAHVLAGTYRQATDAVTGVGAFVRRHLDG